MADDADCAEQEIFCMVRNEVERLKIESEKSKGPLWINGVPLCRECNEPISLERIKILPHTSLCINCAEEFEEMARRAAIC